MKTMLEWKLSHSSSAEIVGEEWINATVPGCVQLDMAAAHNIPLYYTGDHEEKYTWMEDEYWRYRTSVYIEDSELQPVLVFKSVEYKYDVFVNGELLHSHEGMFTESRIDLTAYKAQNIDIEVLIYPVPKRPGSYAERGLGNQASASCKPAFSYGWDWCLRFVTLGIIDEAYVEYVPISRIDNLKVSYRLFNELKKAKVTFECETNAEEIKYTLFDCNGDIVLSNTVVANEKFHTFEVENPQLWWPHNHGDQPIYTLEISSLKNGIITDTKIRKIGFRRVKLVTNEGVWGRDWVAAVRPTEAPMTLEINGKKIFVKGSNWVPPEMCRVQVKETAVKELLTLLKEANMNALRMWGGGYIHPDFFYDICDELGILVWQEFPLACSCYSDDDEYLKILKQESTAIIENLRVHPSIMLWSGGNELFNDWSRMSLQSKALRLLETQTYLLDEDVPYIYTSPQYGVVHGPYDMIDIHGVEGLTTIVKNEGTAFTEFACGGPSQWEYLESFMSKEAMEKPFVDNMWVKRHAFIKEFEKERWLDIKGIKQLSGCSDDPKEIVAVGNEIQCLMYQCMFESVRRKWPYTSMCMNWCYNEPWPTAAGNGLVNYPAVKRPCYYAIQNALRDKKLSLEFPKVSWKPDETMECKAWLLNDSKEDIENIKAEVYLLFNGKEEKIAECEFTKTNAYTNSMGVEFTVKVPNVKCGRFTLIISSEKDKSLNEKYELFIA